MLTKAKEALVLTWCSLGLIMAVAIGCMPKPVKSTLVPKFSQGEIVESALTGEKLMVMRVYTYSTCVEYRCRIGTAAPIERDGFFSHDTVNSRFALERFVEFELRKAKEE